MRGKNKHRLSVVLLCTLIMVILVPSVAHTLTIDINNNVGIGTNTPTQPLDVVGNVNASGTVSANSFSGNGTLLTNLNGANIAAGTVGNGSLAAGAVTSSAIAPSAVGSAALASGSVTAGAIAAGAVTDASITGPISALKINTTGLDADTVDGYHATALLAAAQNPNVTTTLLETAVGYLALKNNNGDKNSAVGNGALFTNTTGIWNTAVGDGAMYYNNGSYNSAVGKDALLSNTTGRDNVAVGVDALASNTVGSYNTAGGAYALQNNTTANQNTAIGDKALYTQSFDNGGVAWSSENTAVGYQALYLNQPTSIASGYLNTALGSRSLYSNTTGGDNTASGAYTLFSNSTGNFNTAIGDHALYLSDTGNGNTAIGIGAGSTLTTGSNNIYIGWAVSGSAESNVTRIGNNSTTQTIITGIYGNSNGGGIAVYVDSFGQLGTSTSSRRFKEDIQDMGDVTDGLMKLRPVTFFYKPEYAKGSHVLQYGLIAEEVAAVYPELVQYTEKGEPNAVYYQMLDSMLLNEVQKQQQKIEHLTKIVDEKDSRIEKLEKQLETIERRLAAIESSSKTVAFK